MLQILSPASAEAARITRMLSAALTAVHRLRANVRFGVSAKKDRATYYRIKTARTVTMACAVWRGFTSTLALAPDGEDVGALPRKDQHRANGGDALLATLLSLLIYRYLFIAR